MEGYYNSVQNFKKVYYRTQSIIGKGSFGVVYSAVNDEGDLVAIKTKKNLRDKKLMRISNELFRGELDSLYELNHPNILQVLGFEYDNYDVKSIIMEHIPGENLNQIIKKNIYLPEILIKIYTKQILLATTYLHYKNIIHRDIKSSNIMITNDYFVKIVDFGMAKKVNSAYTPQSDSNLVGTLPYMAPEMLNSSIYDARIDVWSLGVLLFEMANGEAYFHDENNATITLAQYQDILNLENLSIYANNFMMNCLIKDYNFRPTCHVLMQHPFLMS